jgi:hypothetical protein
MTAELILEWQNVVGHSVMQLHYVVLRQLLWTYDAAAVWMDPCTTDLNFFIVNNQEHIQTKSAIHSVNTRNSSNSNSSSSTWYLSQGHHDCLATAHTCCTKSVQVETWCIHKQNIFSFSNITFHWNHLLLFGNNLAMHILTECQIR